MTRPDRRRLLCVCHDFYPEVNPTTIRCAHLLRRLAADHDIDVVTAVPGGALPGSPGVAVHVVPPTPEPWLESMARRNRLGKVLELAGRDGFGERWVRPASRFAVDLARRKAFDAAVVFMMPYPAGEVGLAVRRAAGVPLVMNFDDSPTCSDMHGHATYLHYRAAVAREDRYVRSADAAVYVSRRNRERVRDRQPPDVRDRLHLIRYGVNPPDFDAAADGPAGDGVFRIVYTGGMTGWTHYVHRRPWPLRVRLYQRWVRLGRYEASPIDHAAQSPVAIARAVQSLGRRRPEFAGRVRIEVHGSKFPRPLVERALANAGVDGLVRVSGEVSNAGAVRLMRGADLLLLSLPGRPDGTPGGRISAKTYEYLMTDRPILAAVPPGESRDYLAGRPGVWVVDPGDSAAMESALDPLVAAAAAGRPLRFDRRSLRDELSYDGRADQFRAIFDALGAGRGSADADRPRAGRSRPTP